MNDYFVPDHEPHATSCRKLYTQAIEEMAIPPVSTRLETFPLLDKLTGGLRPREFSILCGGTGVGKTCLLANLSASLLKQKEHHFVASVETGATDFIKRIISALARRDYNHGSIVPIEYIKKVHDEFGKMLESEYLQLSLYDNRFSVETLMSDIAWHVENKHTKIAMIDNLNFFMEVTKAADQVSEMDRVIHELIIFCKRVDVHLIMVMHPKKNDTGRAESEFDIKGSSTAVQEAHNIFLFNRAHPDLIADGLATKGDREIKIQKMRRLGKYVGSRLILGCHNGIAYFEKDILE